MTQPSLAPINHSLPHLLTEIGPYFLALRIPNFCLGPPLTIRREGGIDRAIFDSPRLPNCPLTLIEVQFARDGHFASNFVEGQAFLIVNRLRNEIEKIAPLAPHLEAFTIRPLVEAQLGGLNYSSLRPEDLPPGDPYFSAVYYLETRLKNPLATREEILEVLRGVTPEQIISYRDQLLGFIPPPSPNLQKGIVLCAGRRNLRDLPAFLPQGVDWVTVDANLDSEPHILGEYSSFETIKRLGLFSWDYVYIGGCPVGLSPIDFQNAIRAGRWLLKRGGQLFIQNYYVRQRGDSPMNPQAAEVIRQQRLRDAERELQRIVREEFFSGVQAIGRNLKLNSE